MRYVGMDVHARQTTICVLDEHGRKERTWTIHGSWEKVLEALGEIKGPWSICFEASTGYGYLYERLKAMAAGVKVAHPGHLRLIFRSKRKSDRVDAEKLAKLLFLDEVPAVYVPAQEVRSWRGMIEYRQKLLGERVRTKNAIRALVRHHGHVAPYRLWTKKGVVWLKGLEFQGGLDALQRDIQVERLESTTRMLRRVEKVLKERAEKHPGVCLLMDIPGVGIRTAEAVMAYLDDPGRFSGVKAVACYFGMVPCQDQSSDKNRLGHITRQGPPTVRKLLTEAAWQAIRRDAGIRAYFERIQQNSPDRKKIAVVATAHYLLRVMFAMLRTGEHWRASAA